MSAADDELGRAHGAFLTSVLRGSYVPQTPSEPPAALAPSDAPPAAGTGEFPIADDIAALFRRPPERELSPADFASLRMTRETDDDEHAESAQDIAALFTALRRRKG